VLTWLSVWSKVQMICIWSSWYHCHPVFFCFIKIQNGLPLWCWLTQVVLERRPLNGCDSNCILGESWTGDLSDVDSILLSQGSGMIKLLLNNWHLCCHGAVKDCSYHSLPIISSHVISVISPDLISSELSTHWLVAATADLVTSQVRHGCDQSWCIYFRWSDVRWDYWRHMRWGEWYEHCFKCRDRCRRWTLRSRQRWLNCWVQTSSVVVGRLAETFHYSVRRTLSRTRSWITAARMKCTLALIFLETRYSSESIFVDVISFLFHLSGALFASLMRCSSSCCRQCYIPLHLCPSEIVHRSQYFSSICPGILILELLIEWIKVLHRTRYKIGHFGDYPPSQSLG